MIRMNKNNRRNRHRIPSHRMRLRFLRPQGDGQIRPFPPERTLRLVQEHRFRRIRHRPDSGLPQDLPGKTGTVHKKKRPDLPGIGEGMGTVADHRQRPGGKGGNRGSMGCLRRILRNTCRRSLRGNRIRRNGIINHILISGRPGCVLRVLVRFADQDGSLQGSRIQPETGTEGIVNQLLSPFLVVSLNITICYNVSILKKRYQIWKKNHGMC